MRRTFLFALALSLAGCCDRTTDASEDSRVADASRPLVFLTHPTDSQCSYTNAQGECAGSDVDLARRIAAKMGRKLVCEAVDFEFLIPRLKAGTADFAIATITITEARRRDVDFTEPYEVSGNCFLYRANGPKPRMSQVASMRIATETGTTGDLYLCQHGCDPVRYSDMAASVVALKKGEIDAIFFDAPPLQTLAERSGGALVASPLETREGYGVAVDKRRPDVLAAANAVIAEGKETK